MGNIVSRYKDKRIYTEDSDLVLSKTGETIDITNGTIYKRTSTGEITVNYKEYVYMDTEKIRILLGQGLSQVELALLITISNNLLIGQNICMQDDELPHTTKSFANLIGNSQQATKKKLNILISRGLLYYGKVFKEHKYGKVYVINPHIIKKGHKLNENLISLFDDIN